MEVILMAAYYYTKTPEIPKRYHTDQSCSEGLKIESQNSVDTDIKPADRTKCEVCK
jgi:hypothetical protein